MDTKGKTTQMKDNTGFTQGSNIQAYTHDKLLTGSCLIESRLVDDSTLLLHPLYP
mgnify:CR=1 FL=1